MGCESQAPSRTALPPKTADLSPATPQVSTQSCGSSSSSSGSSRELFSSSSLFTSFGTLLEFVSTGINGNWDGVDQRSSYVGLYRTVSGGIVSFLILRAVSLSPPFQRVRKVADLLSQDFIRRSKVKGRLVAVDFKAKRVQKKISPSNPGGDLDQRPIVLKVVAQSPFERLPFLNTLAVFSTLHSSTAPLLVELRHASHPPLTTPYDGVWLRSFADSLPSVSVSLSSRRLSRSEPDKDQVAVGDVTFRSPAFPYGRRDLLSSLVLR